jgi:hypothetical protein
MIDYRAFHAAAQAWLRHKEQGCQECRKRPCRQSQALAHEVRRTLGRPVSERPR